jgi:hypothetical protein
MRKGRDGKSRCACAGATAAAASSTPANKAPAVFLGDIVFLLVGAALPMQNPSVPLLEVVSKALGTANERP